MAEDLRALGDPGAEQFKVDCYSFFQLNRILGRYNVVIEAELKKIDIDIPTWRVLMVLGEKSPQPLGQIAKMAVINLSTLMRIIERMSQAKLVESSSSPTDGRINQLGLTPAGRKQLAAARALTAPIYQKLIRDFSAKDFSNLLTLLNRLYTNLGD